MRKGIIALAIVFLAAHLPFLPPTLEDIDSINFALGVRDFDVAKHQPHPPGYPLFIALGKVSTPVMRAAGVPAAEPRGIAVWSAISGAALVLLLFAFFRALDGDDRRAGWAVVITTLSPLFWFTALRPLSDMTGLAAAVAAQVLILLTLTGRGTPPSFLGGAFLAGLAIGFRSQSFLLTLPLLGLAMVMPPFDPAQGRPFDVAQGRRAGLGFSARLAAVAAFIAGVLAWAIPLVVASGGPEAYAAALGTQAGEDFSGVVMLWNMRTARVAADALVYSFLWPWGSVVAGTVAVLLGVLGAARAAWRIPRTLFIVLVAFVPYAIFHLLFHEVVTVRYALPLVIPVAWLIAYAIDALPRPALPIGVVAAATLWLALSVPATARYGRDGSPTFRAFHAVEAGDRGGGAVIGMHAVARRASEWLAPELPLRVLKAPHGREWLNMVEQWRTRPGSAIWFVADPRRTDLALFDAHAIGRHESYRWGFVEPPFVGGARPGNADLYLMERPGWMLDRGWAVTPEVAGTNARDGWGPHLRPSVAWLRTRGEDALLMIGGRNLGATTDPAARITLTLGGRALHDFEAPPGFFFQLVPLPAGALAGAEGYVPLEVTSRAADVSARPIAVGLEQFDLQGGGVVMSGVESGWQEPEFNPLTYQSWRWTTEKATLWVRPTGRDVTLTLSGESPLRYYDSAPTVTVSVGATTVVRFNPAADFRQQIVLPAAALASADGRVIVASDKWFIPGDRDRSPDRRHLALRIYSYAVK